MPDPANPILDDTLKTHPSDPNGALNGLEDAARQLELIRHELAHEHRLNTLGTLSAVIAHEYNNIMTPLISYAQMALARPNDAAMQRKAIEKALASGRRAVSLSESLLAFAGTDGAAQKTSEPATLVGDCVEQARRCLIRGPEKDGITVTVELPQVRVAMAAIHLEQVFVNLFLNAMTAITGTEREKLGRGGGKIEVTGEMSADHLALAVNDNGPGIDAEVLPHLFEPFVRGAEGSRKASNGHNDAGAGTGLGLSLCKRLVVAAGGQITAENCEEGGACFILKLPIWTGTAGGRTESADENEASDVLRSA